MLDPALDCRDMRQVSPFCRRTQGIGAHQHSQTVSTRVCGLKRSEFEHAIRAAGAILATDRVLVIGSQAIHGSMDELFEEAERSIEVDVASLDNNADYSADLIDGSIGELSMFQSTFGYYAQGVTPDTAVLPKGWRKRLVPFNSPATNGVTALCLELHDLWLSKAVANRAKDKEFCQL